jgi:hypothetical protein
MCVPYVTPPSSYGTRATQISSSFHTSGFTSRLLKGECVRDAVLPSRTLVRSLGAVRADLLLLLLPLQAGGGQGDGRCPICTRGRAPSQTSKVKKRSLLLRFAPEEASSGWPSRPRPDPAADEGSDNGDESARRDSVEGQENGGRAPAARQDDEREAVGFVHQG